MCSTETYAYIQDLALKFATFFFDLFRKVRQRFLDGAWQRAFMTKLQNVGSNSTAGAWQRQDLLIVKFAHMWQLYGVQEDEIHGLG